MKPRPLISICVPTKNREKTLPAVLDAINNQSFDKKKLQLVFVDDNSTDNTQSILKRFKDAKGKLYNEVVIIVESSNLPQARNICVNKSRGECVLFLDSDIVLSPDSLMTLLDFMRVADIASLFYSSFSYEAPKPEIKYVEGVVMGCTIIKREVFEKVGFFDETIFPFEDADFCRRARKLGFKIIFDTTTRLRHMHEQERYGPLTILKYTLIGGRKIYPKLFWRGFHRKRFIAYSIFDLCLILALLSLTLVHLPIPTVLFFSPILAYFLFQWIRRRKLILALCLTINSIIVIPLSLIGAVERLKHKEQV